MRGDLVSEFKDDSGVAFDEAWSPRGDALAVAGLGRALRAWDLRSGSQVLTVRHPELLSCVDWSSTGTHLVSGSSSGEVLVFEASSGALAARAAGHADEVRSVAFSPDARQVASGANDGTVRIWNNPGLTPVTVIPASAALIRSVAWSPDGGSVASGGQDGVLRVWDARTGEPRGGLADHRGFITEVAYSPDGRFLASASADSTVRIWDHAARAYAAVLDQFDQWWVEGLSFSPDGQFLATIDQNGKIRVWRPASREVVLTLDAGGFNKTVSWSPDGRHLVSGGPQCERAWALSPSGESSGESSGAAEQSAPERTAAQAAPSPGEGWHPDPDGAHQLRYHDGTDWTLHVADQGRMSQAPRARAGAREPGGAPAAGEPAGGTAGAWTRQLALEYGRACSAVMAAANAALAVANEASGAWNMAQLRPQHEISIQNFTSLAQRKDAEFGPLFTALQAAVGTARAAGNKLSDQFSDQESAELTLALTLDEQAYSDVGTAIHFLRLDAPADARAFHDLIPGINRAIQATPGFGEPGFPGNIYRDSGGHPSGVNRL